MKPPRHSHYLADLIATAERGSSWMEASALLSPPPTKSELEGCAAYIPTHPNRSAYLALGSLIRHDSLQAHAIPAAIRAQVLCDALAKQAYLNDFVVLDHGDQSVRPAGKALLALGDIAIPYLSALLSDDAAAPMFGSEEATISSIYQYRRKDFGYFFLRRIQGRPYTFAPDPATRDALMTAD